jgi:hypothetical protein
MEALPDDSGETFVIVDLPGQVSFRIFMAPRWVTAFNDACTSDGPRSSRATRSSTWCSASRPARRRMRRSP